jgi:hypothetical protein
MQMMREKYEHDIKVIREETNQKFNQIMAMIRQEPRLAKIKPQALLNKRASQLV